MNHPALLSETYEVQLIVFTVCGVKMAMLGTDVEAVADFKEPIDPGLKILDIYKYMPVNRTKGGRPKNSKMLLLKQGDGPLCIMADSIDEIISKPIDSILPLPEPVVSSCLFTAIWGAILRPQGIVYLLDIRRLKAEETCHRGDAK